MTFTDIFRALAITAAIVVSGCGEDPLPLSVQYQPIYFQTIIADGTGESSSKFVEFAGSGFITDRMSGSPLNTEVPDAIAMPKISPSAGRPATSAIILQRRPTDDDGIAATTLRDQVHAIYSTSPPILLPFAALMDFPIMLACHLFGLGTDRYGLIFDNSDDVDLLVHINHGPTVRVRSGSHKKVIFPNPIVEIAVTREDDLEILEAFRADLTYPSSDLIVHRIYNANGLNSYSTVMATYSP